MIHRFERRRYFANATASIMIAGSACLLPPATGQEQGQQNQAQSPTQSNEQTTQETPRASQSNKAPNERADDETPALGILAGPCPGKAVCVKATMPQSPADEAGIEPGDYILSVDGNEVTSPGALRKLIDGMKPNTEVTLKVWRQGEEMECKVHLASKADQLPKGHDAWLGVMLASDEKGEVRINHIVPSGPASESELEEGDVIVKVKNEDIKDAQTFIEKIEEMGPGDELQLTVNRDGEKREVTVTLGSFSDAPMALLRQLHSGQQSAFQSDDQFGNSAALQLMDNALDDLRKQIRALRNEIREMKGEKSGKDKDKDPKTGKVSSLPNSAGVKLVAQIQTRFPQANNLRRYFNQGYNNQGYNNQGYNNQGYNRNNYSGGGRSSYYGNYGNNFRNNYYGNNYGYPNRGSNYYYRYGGQPYYFGGNSNWYGNRPRSSIQLGPNAGVYWY